MSRFDSRARLSLFASLVGLVLFACSGDDNGGAGSDDDSGPGTPLDGGGDSMPPGPCDCSSVACQGAPPVDPTIVTSFYEANRFIYEGVATGQCVGHPLQTGVAPGTIDAKRDVVVLGKIGDANAAPIGGVTVTVVGHPEYGQTISAPDGTFQLALNGGGQMALRYAKDGFLAVQRHVETRWNQYAHLPDVVLTPAATKTTAVTLGGASSIADADPVTDKDGTRAAHVYFAPGTTATAVAQNGTKTSLSSFHLRMTELTQGASGPAAMPGDLPATSAYTYCNDFAVDEAPDAARVELNPPAIAYVDDFLDFKAGTKIPAGAFVPDADDWAGAPSGVAVKVLTAGSTATLDVNGDGVADSGVTLTALGITNDELAQIGAKFSAGATIWRVPLPHFSFWDFNFGFGPPAGAKGKDPNADNNNKNDCSSTSGGSILYCESQGLGEREPLAGTGLALGYTSERQAGYGPARTLTIHLSDPALPPGLVKITLQTDVAGQHTSQDFTPAPNLTTTFTWDGNDLYGRPIQGTQPVKLTLDYWYDAIYQATSDFGYYGNGTSVVTNSGKGSTRAQIAIENISYANVTAWRERGFGLDGWSLTDHHVFDPNTNTLYFGSGDRESVETLGAVQTLVAGAGVAGSSGDGGQARQATLNSPHGIAVSPDGTAFVSDEANHKIRKIDPSGVITTYAGTGTPGFSGDGGPATSAQLQNPMGLALGADGSLYVADSANSRVRRIAPNGTISTFAGTGTAGYTGDGGLATAAQFKQPHALAIGPDQSLYITDTGSATVRRVMPNGVVTTVTGTGTSGSWVADGMPAATVQLGDPTGIAVTQTGTVYICDRTNFIVWRLGAAGFMDHVAGTPNTFGRAGDGGLAIQALLNNPHDVAVGPDEFLYITDELNGVVRTVNTAGIISTVAGGGNSHLSGIPPLNTLFALPRVIHVMPDGGIWLADYVLQQIYRFSVPRPLTVGSSYVVPTIDGRAAYFFDFSGRHQKTVDAITGVTLLSFAYDDIGRLASVTDRDGNVTTLGRDATGCVTSITSPWGHVTTMTCDAGGYLATIANPAGETTTYTTSTSGLLATRAAPNGDTNTFTFDTLGRITKDQEPWGGFKTLARSDLDGGWSVAIATAQGRTTGHDIQYDAVNGETRTLHLPDGHVTTWNRRPDQSLKVVHENGAVLQTAATGDPRFDMMAPLTASGSYSTPGGSTETTSQSRAVTAGSSGDPTAPATFAETTTIGGHDWKQAYDASTRTWLMTSPEGRVEQVALDAKGHVIEVDAPSRAPVHTAYDPQGRVSGVVQDARSWGFTYDGRSNLATSTDPQSHTWHYSYDAVGRTTGVMRADGQSLALAYDVNGNVKSVTPPGKTAHQFTYTAGDVPQKYEPPTASGTGATNTTYSFSQDLDLGSFTRADSRTVTFGYDTAGRLASSASSVGTTTLGYDATTGMLSSVADPDGESLAIAMDGELLAGQTWSGPVAGSVTYQYDGVLRVSQVTAGGTSTTFGYDNDNLLTSAGSETLTRFAADGYLSGTTLGAATDARTYSEYGELATYAASVSGTAIFSQNFTRDGLGRVTSLDETVDGATHTWAYTYDLADRLATVSLDGRQVSSYTYDANGNATSATVRGVTSAGTFDAQDRMTSLGGATYDWTAQGELAAKHEGAATTTYTSDSLGRLQSVALPSGHTVSYVYDGSNRRVGKKVDGALVQGFLYQGALKPVVELDGAGSVVSRFVYGSSPLVPDYVIRGGSTYRIFSDQIGSPRVVVDVSSGAIVERIDYDERGNVLRDTNAGFIPFGFAGGIVDRDTGFVRFGARDYDPQSGRWTSKEPLRFDGAENFYEYAGGDPVNWLDFNGLDMCPAGALAGGFALGFAEGFIEDYAFNAAAQVLASEDGSYDVCEATLAGITGGISKGLGNVANGACFAPETPVATEYGERPIADIAVGDEVWSQDETTGERSLRKVVQKFVTPGQPLLDLDVVADAKDEVVRATPTHRFWVDGKGWTEAQDLRAGDTFDLYSGKHAVLAQVEREPQRTTVFNLEVDGTHTYFVGDDGVWVHNGCRGKNRLRPDPNAEGPHATFKTNASGKVTGYAEWTPNPQNPSGFDPVKRVDTQYGNPHSHGGVSTPHTHDSSGVRSSWPWELPK